MVGQTKLVCFPFGIHAVHQAISSRNAARALYERASLAAGIAPEQIGGPARCTTARQPTAHPALSQPELVDAVHHTDCCQSAWSQQGTRAAFQLRDARRQLRRGGRAVQAVGVAQFFLGPLRCIEEVSGKTTVEPR